MRHDDLLVQRIYAESVISMLIISNLEDIIVRVRVEIENSHSVEPPSALRITMSVDGGRWQPRNPDGDITSLREW